MKVRNWTWVTSWPVVGLWIVVSLSVTVASFGALFTPAWFIRETADDNWKLLDDAAPSMSTSFGVWTWCTGREYVQCAPVGENVFGEQMYASSMVWSMVGTIYGGGTTILGMTSLAGSLILMFSSSHTRPDFVRTTSKIQAAAVSLQVLGLIMYPLGLNSPFVKSICGLHATSYSSGYCSLGYAYMLAIASAALAVYCPILAKLTVYKEYEKPFFKWNNLL